MTRKISNLNQLINSGSFIQLNLIKGFEYLDKTGEIINLFHLDDKVPVIESISDGLVIDGVDKHIEKFKVNPAVIWSKSFHKSTLTEFKNSFIHQAKNMLRILGVEKLGRVGWRTQFIYEFPSQVEAEKALKRLNFISDLETDLVRFSSNPGSEMSQVTIVQVLVSGEDKDRIAFLFDIDLFSQTTGIDQFGGTLDRFKLYYESKEFYSIINKFIK